MGSSCAQNIAPNADPTEKSWDDITTGSGARTRSPSLSRRSRRQARVQGRSSVPWRAPRVPAALWARATAKRDGCCHRPHRALLEWDKASYGTVHDRELFESR